MLLNEVTPNATEFHAADQMLCRSSLSWFVRTVAFPAVRPGTPYVHNWHIDCLCEYLHAVNNGDILRLIINMPPRSLKSITVSVAWPAWLLGINPSTQIICASYSQPLAFKDSTDTRLVMESERYKEVFPGAVINADQNEKRKFQTTLRGHRIATSVGGTIVGEGGDVLLADDIIKPDEAPSKVIRQSTNDWLEQSFLSRENNPGKSKVVLVMQRVHVNDPTGFLMEKGGWTQVKLPAEFTAKTFIDLKSKDGSYGFQKVLKEGDLLFPERMGRKILDDIRQQRGEYAYAGQYQQEPVPEGGGIFKKEYFKLWPAGAELPKLEFIVQSWDTAFTEKTSGDPTACLTLGVFNERPDADEPKYGILVLDAWHDNLAFHNMRTRCLEEFEYRYGPTKRKIDVVLVEEKGSGISMLQELRMTNLPAVSYNPGKQDKEQRAHVILPYVEKGIVYFLESEKDLGAPKSWMRPFISQITQFPYDEHDDYVDAFTQAMRYIINMDWVPLNDEVEEDREEQLGKNLFEEGNPYAI